MTTTTPGQLWRTQQRRCVCCGERATDVIGGQDPDGHVWIHDVCAECRDACDIDDDGQPQIGGDE